MVDGGYAQKLIIGELCTLATLVHTQKMFVLVSLAGVFAFSSYLLWFEFSFATELRL